MDILIVGESVIDFLPGEDEGVYIRKAGGAPANVAVAVSRQGCTAAFCTMAGDDDFGRFLVKTLKENNVELLLPQLTDKAVTTMAFVTLNNGERSFTFARKPGADMFMNKSQLTDEALNAATIIHAGSCSLSKGDAIEATRYALEQGHKRGKLVSFDVNYRDLLWDGDAAAASKAVMEILPNVDLLKISDDELEMVGGEAALPGLMEKMGITLVVETLGSKGARYLWKDKDVMVEGLHAKCVDSTGAGDSFWSGFLADLIKVGVKAPEDISNEILLHAMHTGNISAALCIGKKGAMESLPTAAQVAERMREHYGE